MEPIISEELWQRCNDLLERRRVTGKRPSKRVAHLFTGLVKCHCGTKMYVPSNTPKYVCFSCHNKIPIVDLDNVFRDQLLRYMVSPQNVVEYLKKANEAVAAKEALLESMNRERERVAKDCDCTYELYKQGGLTVSQFKERYHPLDTRKQQIDEEFPHLQGELDVLRIDTLSEEYLTKEAQGLHARWPSMNAEERRRIVEQIVLELTVGAGEISIKFCQLPAFEQMTERQRTVWPPSLSWRRSAALRPRHAHILFTRDLRSFDSSRFRIASNLSYGKSILPFSGLGCSIGLGCRFDRM